jgi:hypothetical protein
MAEPVAQFKNCVFTAYSDKIAGSINSEKVFGRTDPIYRHGGNSRTISATFTTTMVGEGAIQNLTQLSSMAVAMYPRYSNSTKTIISPPLFIIRFGRFMTPVLGFVDSLDYTVNQPNLANSFGYIGTSSYAGGEAVVVQNTLKVQLNVNVIHSAPVYITENGMQSLPLEAPFIPRKTS